MPYFMDIGNIVLFALACLFPAIGISAYLLCIYLAVTNRMQKSEGQAR